MKTAATAAEELIRLALNWCLWRHESLPTLSPVHATSLAESSLLPPAFVSGFIKETGTSTASHFHRGSSVGMTGAAELPLQEAAFPRPLRVLPSQPMRPARQHTAPAPSALLCGRTTGSTPALQKMPNPVGFNPKCSKCNELSPWSTQAALTHTNTTSRATNVPKFQGGRKHRQQLEVHLECGLPKMPF